MLFGFAVHWYGFVHPLQPITHHSDAFLYKSLISDHLDLFLNHTWLNTLLVVVFVCIQAFFLNYLAIEQKLFLKNQYLPGMTYVLFSAQLTEWNALSPGWIASTILAWVLVRSCQLHKSPKAGQALFGIGFAIGVASLLYFASMVFILLVMVALILIRPFRLSEWVLIFIGFLTPIYFVLSFLFLTDRSLSLIVPDLGSSLPNLVMQKTEWAALAIILLVVLSGWFLIQQNLLRLLVQSRKSWSIIFVFFLVALAIAFLNESPTNSNFLFILSPLSVCGAAAFLYPTRRWIPNLSYWALICLAIVTGYFFVMQ